MTLTIISIGLTDEQDLSQRATQAARDCDTLYAELYTTILNTDVNRISDAIGRTVVPLPRSSYEEDSARLLDEAEEKDVGILVGGDALSATTHISLLIDARKRGIETRIIHGSSILTAIAETGLSLYKFGRTVTLPLPEKGPPDTVLRTLRENREHGLHTLVLLDLDTEAGRHLPIPQAIALLLESQTEDYAADTLTITLARIGWGDGAIRAGRASELAGLNYGGPPHALIVPGTLHFLEEEALRTLAGCPDDALKGRRTTGEVQRLIEKYLDSCRNAVDELEYRELPRSLSSEEVKALIEHAVRYLDDAEYYAEDKRATALASVSYAEGILDALRLLGLVEFEW